MSSNRTLASRDAKNPLQNGEMNDIRDDNLTPVPTMDLLDDPREHRPVTTGPSGGQTRDASGGDPAHVSLKDLDDDLRAHRPVTTFLRTDLVTLATDPNLVNPWGMSDTGGGSPIWISQNGAGVTSLYSVAHNATTGADTVAPNAARDPVHIVSATGAALAPTGQVFNPFGTAGAFKVTYPDGTNASAVFLFASEDGSISGWFPGPGAVAAQHKNSVVAVHTPGADYTGLTIDKAGDTPMLFAANFSQGEVDVFDASFSKIATIADPHRPSHMTPFNAQILTVQGVERLFVTFVSDEALTPGSKGATHGGGFVDEFDLQGHLIQRLESDGTLDNPWGLAIAPASFGSFAGDLLVGNHGDGTIAVFDLSKPEDQALGHLLDSAGKAIAIPDLFGLIPGEATPPPPARNNGGSPDTIYFTAGGSHGIFGSLTPNATPLQVGMGSGDH